MTAPLLQLKGISKTFGAVKALKDMDIEIYPNEVIGLVGENGAGKSTLMKILSGVYQPDSGQILRNGRPVTLRSPVDAAAVGIAMVHQEQSLLLNISVAENIYLGREDAFLRRRIIDWKAMRDAAARQLDKVQVRVDPMKRTELLSFAERQMVELAKALTLEEDGRDDLVVFLDEPTSVLEQAEIHILFDRVRALRSRASFVFVSHRLDEILDLSDRIYVLRDGEVVAHMPTGEATVHRLHELMVGQEQHTEYYREDRQKPPATKVALKIDRLTSAGHYSDIGFELHEGEVLGIAGVIGSGREELSRTLAGLMQPTSGTVELFGKPVAIRNPSEAVRLGIGYVPQERRTEGLVLPMTMGDNMTLPALGKFSKGGFLFGGNERGTAEKWVKRLTIRPPNPVLPCSSLSGGNQQKVVLAKWIEAGVRVLILDHPTRGLDVGAKQDVYALVRDLCEQGVAVLLTADTLEETIGLSHTILVMRDGRITERFQAVPGHKPQQVDLIQHMV
jgi:ribose transport system ATP-binding protein